jgi:hypothetical protein
MEQQRQRLLGERGQKKVTRTDLIEEFGYDTKYLMHVLRLGYQGIELLETGKLVLPLTGRTQEILLAVKTGKWTLNEGLQLAGDLEQRLKDLISDGPIRPSSDHKAIEDWMREAYRTTWEKTRSLYADVTKTIH